MLRLTVLAMIGAATALAQDPTFKVQMEALAAQVQAQQVTRDAAFRLATANPLDVPAVAPQTAQAAPQPKLGPKEHAALVEALDRAARCVTGKLIKDPDSVLWIPEMKPGCLK